jgi:TPR repeat protein
MPQVDLAMPPARTVSLKGWLGLTIGVIAAAGGIAYWLMHSRAVEAPATHVALPSPAQTTPEAVPPEVRSYLDQAKAGDGKAMHMIALMYWNGLNVRQDRVKGLEWYRKAAAAGDKAAQKELAVIEGK